MFLFNYIHSFEWNCRPNPQHNTNSPKPHPLNYTFSTRLVDPGVGEDAWERPPIQFRSYFREIFYLIINRLDATSIRKNLPVESSWRKQKQKPPFQESLNLRSHLTNHLHLTASCSLNIYQWVIASPKPTPIYRYFSVNFVTWRSKFERFHFEFS